MKNKEELFSYEQVLSDFNKKMSSFINDSNRVPARDNSQKAIFDYASKIYNKYYKDALHKSILDKYKA